MSVVLVIFLLFLQLRISFQFYKKELKTHLRFAAEDYR